MLPLQLLLDPPLAAWPTMVAISTNIEIKKKRKNRRLAYRYCTERVDFGGSPYTPPPPPCQLPSRTAEPLRKMTNQIARKLKEDDLICCLNRYRLQLIHFVSFDSSSLFSQHRYHAFGYRAQKNETTNSDLQDRGALHQIARVSKRFFSRL